jgi:hypothetical protein
MLSSREAPKAKLRSTRARGSSSREVPQNLEHARRRRRPKTVRLMRAMVAQYRNDKVAITQLNTYEAVKRFQNIDGTFAAL